MSKDNKHLPLFGVGPVIVYGQVLITAIAIWLTYVFDVGFASFSILKVPFLVVGILLIIFGFYLDLSAKYKSKLFKNVEENKLITDGVYAYTRNPVYSGGFLICVGAIFIANNLLLFIIPVICWIYMTVFLIKTEEVWLKDLYGKEYIEYCKKVNRCIPWVPKKDRAKKIFSPLMAILSIVSPICIVGIMCMIETEIIEAVISGLALGCMVGSVFSIIFWVTNKDKNKILKIISLIPLVFVGLYALLFIRNYSEPPLAQYDFGITV